MRRSRSDRVPLPAGFGTLWTTVAIDLLGFGIILPVLGLYTERFGAGPITVGFLVASFSLAQFVCAPILGRWSDRIGRKPIILLSLLGTAVGSFLTGAAVGVWMLFLGRIVDGASGASVSVAQGAVTDMAPPGQRARLLGLLGAAFGVGFVLGPALGGLAALVGERVPFYVAGVIALANLVVAAKRLPETNRAVLDAPLVDVTAAPEEVPSRQAAGEHRRLVALRRFAIVAFVATAAFSGFEATFALFGERRFDLTEGSVAAVFVGVGIFLVAVQAGLVAPVTERIGLARTLRGGLLLVSIGLVLLALSHSWWLLVPALALLVVGQGLVSPSLSASVADRAEEHRRGGALGTQQAAAALARVVGPACAGVLFHISVPLPYLVGAGLTLGALALAATTSSAEVDGSLPTGNL